MGFPCNQFGAQEPGTDEEILAFATTTYSVTFPLFSKIEVNGEGACALFQWLAAALPKADGDPSVAWNFTKFLVGRDGTPLQRFEPKTTPEEIGQVLEALL